MFEFFDHLFDTDGFVPRKTCGDWTTGLIWLHRGSDLLIWLAYLSIPVVLGFFGRQRRGLPFHHLFWLFGAFILACGFTHFLDALMFDYPAYRLGGLLKFVTAVVSWGTVVAMIPAVPKVLALVDHRGLVEPRAPAVPAEWSDARAPAYIVAVLAVAGSLAVRSLLDPLLDWEKLYILPLTAVVYLAWRWGFGPALLTLLGTLVGTVYFFVEPRGSLLLPTARDQLATGMFLFCGIAVSLLGEAQRNARRQVSQTLAELRESNDALAKSQIELERDAAIRIQAALDLKESEARFRLLSESVPQIVWVTRPDGYHEYYNQRWYEYTGLSVEESIGFGWSGPLHPDDRARAEARWKLATDTGDPYEIEYRFRGRDGRYRWFIGRAVPRRDERGDVVQWFGTCTDIDEVKRLQSELQASEELFRTLTEATPQMVWTTSPSGECNYLSRQWVDYTGVPVANHLGYGWLDSLHPDDRDPTARVWEQAVAGTAAYDVEFRIRSRLGVYRWFKVRGVPQKDEAGAVARWVGTCTDIDDRKREAEHLEAVVRDRTALLTEQQKALASSNAELEQFAYVASHDLQEPLRKIQAFGDRLAKKYRSELGDQGKEYLDRMLASAGRMRVLIDDLLSLSRVTTRGRTFEPVDLAGVVREAVSDLEIRLGQTGGRIDVGPLPTLAAADPGQFRQLFVNLLGNALKFHKPHVPPVVTVSACRADELPADADPPAAENAVWRVTVSDNGIGFEQAYAERIFEVFQRLQGRAEYEGSGIGLAICRKIVERHGGAIAARGVPGSGASIVIDLPA